MINQTPEVCGDGYHISETKLAHTLCLLAYVKKTAHHFVHGLSAFFVLACPITACLISNLIGGA